MSCPQCGKGEIDSEGLCLACGFRTSADAQSSASDSSETAGDNPCEEFEDPSEKDLPQWRRDLSQRIQEVKQKRETMKQSLAARDIPADPPPSKEVEDAGAAALRAELIERMKKAKAAPKPVAPIPIQKTLQPLTPPADPQSSQRGFADPQNVENYIDSVVYRKINPAEHEEKTPESSRLTSWKTNPTADPEFGIEGKLILLTRTLSGLVDLILIILCTGLFIVAADHFWGIRVVDGISLFHFSMLFLLNYFVYSLFFLASSNQTVGMMITELRLVGPEELRPSFRQVAGRSCLFLISLLGLGIGLIWSLFSKENQCLHDRLSGTYVVRI